MDIKNLILEEKIIEVEHPVLDGFKVEIAYLSRERVKKLLDKATSMSYDKRTHQPKETVDDKLFMQLYAKELIRGWKGLTAAHLAELVPVNLDGQDLDAEIEYTAENAEYLLKSSSEIDNWLSSVISEVKNFNKNS